MKVNYRLRDAIFSRQRYWERALPGLLRRWHGKTSPGNIASLRASPVASYKTDFPWTDSPRSATPRTGPHPRGFPLEVCTMPGFAGSSAYYLRYMDPHNSEAFVSREANEYWRDVDLYVERSGSMPPAI